MINPPDIRLSDTVLLDEIDLLTDLVIAATASSERFSVKRIDEVLGVVKDVARLPAVPQIPKQQQASTTVDR